MRAKVLHVSNGAYRSMGPLENTSPLEAMGRRREVARERFAGKGVEGERVRPPSRAGGTLPELLGLGARASARMRSRSSSGSELKGDAMPNKLEQPAQHSSSVRERDRRTYAI